MEPLAITDSTFILELLNTDAWKEFIGNSKVLTEDDAERYIERVSANPNTIYWVATLKEGKTRVGLVTLVKCDYIQYPDIGFAFLPAYGGVGYAYDATQTVVNYVTENGVANVMAITVPQNAGSIKLLQKLGFIFRGETMDQPEKLHVYGLHKSSTI